MGKIILGGLVLAAIGLAIGIMLYSKPASTVTKGKAEATVSAVDLMSHYESDEPAANEQFLGKILEVTGIVQEISNGAGDARILLATESMLGTINCEMGSTTGLEELSTGSEVRIKGECTGYLMDVVLHKCTIVTK